MSRHKGLFSGDRRALARAITALENETEQARDLLAAVHRKVGNALVVGFTGAPGVGKSTLVSAYIRELRGRGKTVGVVAVDPSSPLTGGAILGDRVRMAEHGQDDGVFVRSLASRGHQGGLSRAAARVVDVMDAAGRDVVIVETVGTGQSEIEVSEIATTNVVVYAPGLGDQIQALKAGVLETAHVIVVNKSDLPHAETAAQQLEQALALSPREGWQVPVLRTAAATGEGVKGLAHAIASHGKHLGAKGRREAARLRMRRLIASTAARQVCDTLTGPQAAHLDELSDAVLSGELELDAAARRAVAGQVPTVAMTDEQLGALAGRDRFDKMLGIEFVEGGPGRAVVRVKVKKAHLNFYGYCHGGLIFSLADAAFGLANNSRGKVSVAISAHLTYANPVREGDELTASATEITSRRRISTYRVEVTKADGTPISTFTGTSYSTGKPVHG
ncbi:MAG: methylmalonyl Co-A mutase-associated GTPase MeaB [SAR324 cluster bacterium]|nr:methylmalonyl Co-A mutase-associated GTPase MeaB [SAR324 cluster bacterium]